MAVRKAGFVAPLGPKLAPKPGQRNILITSALPYVNNVPHLGNIIGCVLSADVYARYCRQRGINTLYICGTDEYGTATETKALEEGLTEQQICDKYHAIHKKVYDWFHINFDYFGRTTTKQQTVIAQDIFKKLRSHGLTKEDSVEQLYCNTCAKFLADRFVEGTCPFCSFPDARGDQCDGCQKLLESPASLVNPRCKTCTSRPELRTSKHIFLDLPKITPRLESWVNTTSEKGEWTPNSINITHQWLKAGLRDRCITRDLKWGTPVPQEGYEKKVFYVWFDAPIGYISITANYTENWEAWWKNAENVNLVQFMGKDNVPFHCVIFPSCLIGTEDPYTLLHHINTTEYLMYEDSKFSKSRGTGIFGDDAESTGISADVYRYYLLVNRPENQDSQFTWKDLALKNNTELLANFGNLVNRVLVFAKKFCGQKVPAVTLTDADRAFIDSVNEKLREYNNLQDHVFIKDALRLVMEISSLGNLYYQNSKAWDVIKTDAAAGGSIVGVAITFIHLLASIIAPFLPGVADSIVAQLGLCPAGTRDFHPLIPDAFAVPHAHLPAGHALGEPEVLFHIITPEQEAELRTRFAGRTNEPAPPAVSPAELEAATAAQAEVVRALKEPGSAASKEEVASAIAVLQYLKGLAPKAEKKGKEAAEPAAGKAAAPASAEKKDKDKKPAAEAGKPWVKGDKKAAAKGAAAKAEGECELDLRVGKIVDVKKHPEADALWVLQVDVGDDAPRQICAGLVNKYSEKELLNRSVVALCNLAPAKLKNQDSLGMLLAASHGEPHTDGEVVALLEPAAACKPGDRVAPKGLSAPSEAKQIKKSKLEKHKLATGAGASVLVDDQPISTASGVAIRPDSKRPVPDGSVVR